VNATVKEELLESIQICRNKSGTFFYENTPKIVIAFAVVFGTIQNAAEQPLFFIFYCTLFG